MDERIMHQILGKQGRSINLEWRHSLNGWWATNNNYRSPPVDPRLGLTTPSWTKRDWFEDAVESYLYWVGRCTNVAELTSYLGHLTL